jgi:hypothetical protein
MSFNVQPETQVIKTILEISTNQRTYYAVKIKGRFRSLDEMILSTRNINVS